VNLIQSLVHRFYTSPPLFQSPRHRKQYPVDVVAPSRQLLRRLRVLRIFLLGRRQEFPLVSQGSFLRLLEHYRLQLLLLRCDLPDLLEPAERDLWGREQALNESLL
jgi:hypothetical protein